MRNLFGTDGIRGCVGDAPLTIDGLHRLGNAISLWAQKKYGAHPTFLLAHDTRVSCSLVKSLLKSGLMLHPVRVYDGDVLPSPAVVQLLYQHPQFNAGIIISASHNPYHDNGIKLVDGALGKISLEDELLITHYFDAHQIECDYASLGMEFVWSEAEKKYIDYVVKFFKNNFLHGIKIVLDCANGAAYRVAPYLFRALGADVIMLHEQPNGFNINKNCGAVHPECLQKCVIEQGADIGFAFDGDADRVIAINRYGHIKNGDDILALLMQHPLYKNTPAIVGTSMTNQGFEMFLHKLHKKLIRTAVGDKYVALALAEQNLLLGGEPSGHIILRDYLNTGDGIFVALRLIETVMFLDNWEMDTFQKFPQIIINVPIEHKKDLTSEPLAQLISANQQLLIEGRLIVRYSGTEHLLRIMIEDLDHDRAQAIGDRLSKQLFQLLN
jgi:phosphoglucosamine mutase